MATPITAIVRPTDTNEESTVARNAFAILYPDLYELAQKDLERRGYRRRLCRCLVSKIDDVETGDQILFTAWMEEQAVPHLSFQGTKIRRYEITNGFPNIEAARMAYPLLKKFVEKNLPECLAEFEREMSLVLNN